MQLESCQRGVSLIEVLVAIVIFSVGVLGIALMQIKGAQYTRQSGARTVAVLQARSLAEAMRANPAGVYGVATVADIPGAGGSLASSYYNYAGGRPPDGSGCGGIASCQQAATDLRQWVAQLQLGTSAPVSSGSSGSVVLARVTPGTTAAGTLTGTLAVAVNWNGMIPNTTTGATTNDTYQFAFQPQSPFQP